uniref:Uncharacterized protein n=1 Tax=Globodera rostochiensis TaxID=31243 RepID=A0A914GVX2_GLORO
MANPGLPNPRLSRPEGQGTTLTSKCQPTNFIHFRTFNRRTFNPWTNPFGDGQRFDSPEQCAANGSTTAWKYRDGFLVSEEGIGKVLDGIIRRTREEYENTLRRLKLTN